MHLHLYIIGVKRKENRFKEREVLNMRKVLLEYR